MIKNLVLENFRNHENRCFELAPLTIFLGQNGTGKTNVLESIFFLATTKSYRTNFERETIRWEKDFCRVVADEKEISLRVLPRFIKQVKINGVKKTLKEFLGKLKVVLFAPEILQIVAGSPSLRRRFLDFILGFNDIFYFQALLELQKILKNRNEVLERMRVGLAKENELIFWDEKLIESGSLITQKRKKLIDCFKLKLSENYQLISGQLKDKLAIDFQETDYTYLPRLRQKEIALATTLIGPQREDFRIFLNQKELHSFGSRGEIRSAVLALKKSELDYLSSKNKTDLILLLDDVFSELDERHREHLVKMTADYQTLITATHLDDPQLQDFKKNGKVILLDGT